MRVHVPAVPDSGRPMRAVPVTVGAPRFAGALRADERERELDVISGDREGRRRRPRVADGRRGWTSSQLPAGTAIVVVPSFWPSSRSQASAIIASRSPGGRTRQHELFAAAPVLASVVVACT